jgi:hypothetical protein
MQVMSQKHLCRWKGSQILKGIIMNCLPSLLQSELIAGNQRERRMPGLHHACISQFCYNMDISSESPILTFLRVIKTPQQSGAQYWPQVEWDLNVTSMSLTGVRTRGSDRKEIYQPEQNLSCLKDAWEKEKCWFIYLY